MSDPIINLIVHAYHNAYRPEGSRHAPQPPYAVDTTGNKSTGNGVLLLVRQAGDLRHPIGIVTPDGTIELAPSRPDRDAWVVFTDTIEFSRYGVVIGNDPDRLAYPLLSVYGNSVEAAGLQAQGA